MVTINQYWFFLKIMTQKTRHAAIIQLTFMCNAKQIHLRRKERHKRVRLQGTAADGIDKELQSTKMDNRASKLLRQCCNDVPVLADIQH